MKADKRYELQACGGLDMGNFTIFSGVNMCGEPIVQVNWRKKTKFRQIVPICGFLCY